MKLDEITIPIEVRSVGQCVDLAIAFYRIHWRPILKLTLGVALPSLLMGHLLASSVLERSSCLQMQLFVFFVTSPLLGALLTIAAGKKVFGTEFRVSSALRALASRLPLFLLLFIYVRTLTVLGLFMFLVVAVILWVRYGFLAELLFLEQLPVKRLGKRFNALLSSSFMNLLGRSLGLILLWVLLSASLFTLIDKSSELLFDAPLFLGAMEPRHFWDTLWWKLDSDPIFAATFLGCGWLVFPLVRIAWFFCYLDIRIRKEGWDLELTFRLESLRLAPNR